MFEDQRSKTVIFVAHCILNQNSISDGTADHPGCIKEIMDLLIASKMGIIQMPCPELHCLGLDRGDVNGNTRPVVEENSRIRKMLMQSENQEKIKKIINLILYQVDEYLKNGFEIKGIVGVDRSPSCGVNSTSINNQEVEGQGVFIQKLQSELSQKNIKIEFFGIKAFEPEKARSTIKNLIE